MLQRLHQRLGTAGMAVAVIALIAALGGTALAASGALTGKQKKEVEKIAKKVSKPGPAGAAGANGTNGKDGAEGKQGPEGKAGTNGTNGTNGDDGEPGKSVEALAIDPGEPECEEQGGAEYSVEGSGEFTQVCNGKEGSPWTAGGTLPPGATETGSWAFNQDLKTFTVEVGGVEEEITVGDDPILVPIGFAVPISGAMEPPHLHFDEGTALPCQFFNAQNELRNGTAGNPKAKPGELCVFTSAAGLTGTSFREISSIAGAELPGANRAGAMLVFNPPTAPAKGWGSFAVTGCGNAAFPCP